MTLIKVVEKWGLRISNYLFPPFTFPKFVREDDSCVEFLRFIIRHFSLIASLASTNLISFNSNLYFFSKELASKIIYSLIREGGCGVLKYSVLQIDDQYAKTAQKIAEAANFLFIEGGDAQWVECLSCPRQHPICFDTFKGKVYLTSTKNTGSLCAF
jgi:hypothetical protein